MKLKVISAALAFALAGEAPTMAKDVVHAGIYCATREAGNPYSKYCDYIADGGVEAVGILVLIMHAGAILIMFRQGAGPMPLQCRPPTKEIVPGTRKLFLL
jgi:hypothetical protein